MDQGLAVAVVADDLTGGADTGVHFAAAWSPFYLLPVATLAAAPPWLAGARGLSVVTDSRQLAPAAAAARVGEAARALAARRPRLIYKKIDSCLRGNLGAEIDALLDGLGCDAALIAPALPAQGRTTVGGVHLVHGRPLAETEFARDPVTPVRSSAVADILAQQSRHACGHLVLDDYGDPGRLRAALGRERARGCRLLVCDAREPRHLAQLAGLILAADDRLLPVGSAGLAARLAAGLTMGLAPGLGRAAGPAHRPALDAPGEGADEAGRDRLLLVCGTASAVTRRQVDLLMDRHSGLRRALAPGWLAGATAAERLGRATELLAAWRRGPLALEIEASPDRTRAPERLVTGLAAVAAEIVRAGRVDALVLTGGATAEAFRRATAGEAIALEREIMPGLVLGRWVGGLAPGLPVITKAGAFGGDATLALLYGRLSAGAPGRRHAKKRNDESPSLPAQENG